MAPRFRRVLVANRGEIAVRICRALRDMGMESVSVYSNPDARCPHVFAATQSFPLNGETPGESYLRTDAILEAAAETGAEAIHPGYGFLSEDPGFARAVVDAGLTYIGPDPGAIEHMGSKRRARETAKSCSLQVVPGFHEDAGNDGDFEREAARVGFPLFVKAAAGGGGKGMRLVRDQSGLADALVTCRSEARAAFGDDRILLEKLVSPARHIEIQVFGDEYGNVIAINERECSIQRRHQKIVEEAPSPVLGRELRHAMCEAAVSVARAVEYRNAGTVEFLLDDEGSFYFLEMNTRLQVEHPVTEMTTGLDLVQLQLQVALGGALPEILGDRDLEARGHAIEVRIYAESPEERYMPCAGRLALVLEPRGPGIRVDSGVESGMDVSVHYDPLLAKLVVHAPDRPTACQKLTAALTECVYLGIPTNVDFLRRIVMDPDFHAGNLRTDFLERKPEIAEPVRGSPPDMAYAAAALCQMLAGRPVDTAVGGGVRRSESDPWRNIDGLRLW